MLLQMIQRRERAKDEALSLLKDEPGRIWFRRKYNLPPTDPRYLDMTDEGIEIESHIHQELQRREDEIRKSLMPHCPKCGYEGPPYPSTTFCPRCGAEMTMPKTASDQTTYVDDDFEATVKDVLEIDFPEELKE